MSNIWLFGSVIQWVLTRKPGTDALQRTTTAVTLISGGEKENVLPTSASATVNRKKKKKKTFQISDFILFRSSSYS
jgi:carboxypeptidase PM20D1